MKVQIIPGCIACGACVSINPDIFEMEDTIHVNHSKVAGHEDDCRAAAEACPVHVIKIID